MAIKIFEQGERKIKLFFMPVKIKMTKFDAIDREAATVAQTPVEVEVRGCFNMPLATKVVPSQF